MKAALERASTAPGGEPSLITGIFFDTPDRKLHQHDLSLCVEQHDASGVQVLRRLGSVADGSQWHDGITGDGPDPLAPETGARLSGLIDKGLRPLCRAQVRRTCLRLDVEPAVEIMSTLDEGTISAAVGDATESMCGLDLEMIEGDPAGFFDVALRLLDAALLRITTSDNAERFYRLLGSAIEAVTAEPLTLEPSMPVEAVLQTSCRLCLRHLLRNQAAALSGDAEALHQMRVAVRRFRSVLAAVRSMLPAEQLNG